MHIKNAIGVFYTGRIVVERDNVVYTIGEYITPLISAHMNKLVAVIKNKYAIGAFIIILLGGGYWYYRGTRPATYNTISIARGQVVEEVSVTGTVKPVQSLDIAFEKTGRVRRISVRVGDAVVEGQSLMQLDNADLLAQLAQAQANLRSQQAKLDQLKAGTRKEDLAITQTQLDSAQKGLTDAKTNLKNAQETAATNNANVYGSVPDTLTDAYTKADDAIRNQINDLFINANSNNPSLSFNAFNYQAKLNAEGGRVQSAVNLATFANELAAVKANPNDQQIMDAALDSAIDHLNAFLAFFNILQDVINGPSNLDSATVSAYKTEVSTGRTKITTALASVNKQKQSIASQQSDSQAAIATAQANVNTAQNAVDEAQKQLALKQAGSSIQDIDYQQSQTDQARANVDYNQALVDKTILRAPFAGKITKIVPVLGDIIDPNKPVLSIIGAGNFQIESYIAEADIAKVKINDSAKVTLDAYGTDVLFDAKVIQIEQSATAISGVATYKTTLQFQNEDSRILSGLTANIDILTNRKDNVLYLPTRIIITEGERKYVKVLVDPKKGTNKEQTIITGLRGSDGKTEILSGLSESDRIIVD